MARHCTFSYIRAAKEESSVLWNDDDDDLDDLDEFEKTLNAEQRRAAEVALAGHSLFLGGLPGTGKSRTIGYMVARLRAQGKRVVVTATTAIAALNIGAITLHSWAGVGTASFSAADLAARLAPEAIARWKATDVLFIDEVSMLSGQLFDKLATIGRIVCGDKNLLFGGIQLVLVGDFFQLPPVWTPADRQNQEHHKASASAAAAADASASSVNVTKEPLFAFQADAWKALIRHTVDLVQVFRQEDPTYLQLLARLRVGGDLPFVCRELEKLKRPLEGDAVITKLMSTNAEVHEINHRELARLPRATERIYRAVDWVAPDLDARTAKAAEQCLSGEDVLTLRLGAHVILTSNVSRDLVNGSQGDVVGVVFDHSCTRARENGHTKHLTCPVVKFHSGQTLIVCPERKEVVIGNRVVSHRDQIPLKLAWAVTIHRSQGLTLDRVVIDLSKCFEKGQAYVALSRCRTLGGMQVVAYDQGRSFRTSHVVALWTRQRRAEGLIIRLGEFEALRFVDAVNEDTVTNVRAVWDGLFEGTAPFRRLADRERGFIAKALKICRKFPSLAGAVIAEEIPAELDAVCSKIEFVRGDGSIRLTIELGCSVT